MPRTLNQVILLGHLGKDAEQRHTPAGVAVASFSLATTNRFKKGEEWIEETDWHNVVLWNSENVSQYLLKGKPVLVQGRLKTRSYEKDGVKKYTTEVVSYANQLTLLHSAPSDRAPHPSGGPASKPAAKAEPAVIDDDVPF